MAERFASLTEDDLSKIIEAKDSSNTNIATKHAVKIFRDYLSEKDFESDFETFTAGELNLRLRSFYAELRKPSGEIYKRTSILAIRSGLNRYMSQTNGFDITKNASFKQANDMFVSVCKDTCKNGKGMVDHKTPTEKADIDKLYESRAFDTDTPCGLSNKVWFEICLYFCRRGRENQRDLKATMFKIRTDADGKKYVCQIDSEISKNHQGKSCGEIQDKNVRMYETQGKHCPLVSFAKYVDKLNPLCSALFQTPKDSFFTTDAVWYKNRPIGKNKLGNRMKELSVVAGLSQSYTNHCIRTTAITALSHAGFEARHIMTVSGHRNESSVKSYVRVTTVSQKKTMSATISSLAPHDRPTSSDSLLEDGFDDLLTLSLSQTENFLRGITDFENCPNTNNLTSTSNSHFIEQQPANPPLGMYQQSLPGSFGGVHCAQPNGFQLQNFAGAQGTQGHTSFSFHGCQIQMHNYN